MCREASLQNSASRTVHESVPGLKFLASIYGDLSGVYSAWIPLGGRTTWHSEPMLVRIAGRC